MCYTLFIGDFNSCHTSSCYMPHRIFYVTRVYSRSQFAIPHGQKMGVRNQSFQLRPAPSFRDAGYIFEVDTLGELQPGRE